MALVLVLPDLRTGVVAFVVRFGESGLPLPASLMFPVAAVVVRLESMRISLHAVVELAPAGS